MSGLNLILGNVLLSRPVARQVPSTQRGLTAVFGMGTGGSPSPSSPRNFYAIVLGRCLSLLGTASAFAFLAPQPRGVLPHGWFPLAIITKKLYYDVRYEKREAGGGNDRSFCLPIFSPFLAPWKLHRKFCLSFDYLDCDA
jgi:hypothetical protein